MQSGRRRSAPETSKTQKCTKTAANHQEQIHVLERGESTRDCWPVLRHSHSRMHGLMAAPACLVMISTWRPGVSCWGAPYRQVGGAECTQPGGLHRPLSQAQRPKGQSDAVRIHASSIYATLCTPPSCVSEYTHTHGGLANGEEARCKGPTLAGVTACGRRRPRRPSLSC